MIREAIALTRPAFALTEHLARSAAEEARIYIDRMGDAATRAARWRATDEQMEGVRSAAADCERALAAAIAKLCGEAV